ncbi:AI-2E family transporter [Fodinicurvata sp. EGI_FJ10296]|uniref:AI-2E family transporter n=1 Tax=Fodinicurvata sp. EGI_FJ10296 TaxID=3231908 RepID=UPI003454F4C7
MNIDRRIVVWCLIAGVGILFLWFVSDILAPFLVGILLAYLCDPACRWLEERGVPRIASGMLIVGGFFVAIAGLIVAAMPILISQAAGFVTALSDLQQAIANEELTPLIILDEFLPDGWGDRIIDIGSESVGWAMESAGQVGLQLLSGGMALFDFVSLMFITPIVAIFAMRDWPALLTHMDDLVPPKQRPIVRSHAQAVDDAISAWMRGQVLVCLILAAFYSVGLTLLGLQYGIFIGVVAGIAAFIPFLGFAVGLALSLIAALVTFDSFYPILATIGVFLAGQALESYYLTPRLVGRSVGLSEVWILFALLAGGATFGFVGILLAMPVAAVLNVLIRSAITAYKQSALYYNEL